MMCNFDTDMLAPNGARTEAQSVGSRAGSIGAQGARYSSERMAGVRFLVGAIHDQRVRGLLRCRCSFS